MITSPAPPSLAEIQSRLELIFPKGAPHRAACVSDVAAKTVFVMLYLDAVEGKEQWIRPDQVTRMTDAQAAQTGDDAREAWRKVSMASSSKTEIPGRWYATNSREGVRDDTIKNALIPNGVVIERPGVKTTSMLPRYALKASFAGLFDPDLTGDQLKAAAATWQQENLSAGALARIALRLKGAVATTDHVLVKFPNGETRSMAVGESSLISKAVIEDFASRFLKEPVVIFLSESRNKVVQLDDDRARSIGLHIKAQKNLPDIILADLGPQHPLLVFVEVVATDGPVSAERRAALLQLTQEAGFAPEHVAFVTAYLDRSDPAFKKTVDQLAWSTFAWFVSEPDNLIRLIQGHAEAVKTLSEIAKA